jgi:hypothetical protein
VDVRLKEDFDAENVPNTGDYPLIEENFSDLSGRLYL